MALRVCIDHRGQPERKVNQEVERNIETTWP